MTLQDIAKQAIRTNDGNLANKLYTYARFRLGMQHDDILLLVCESCDDQDKSNVASRWRDLMDET